MNDFFITKKINIYPNRKFQFCRTISFYIRKFVEEKRRKQQFFLFREKVNVHLFKTNFERFPFSNIDIKADKGLKKTRKSETERTQHEFQR